MSQETGEGYTEELAFGLAAMQGWRVSMVRGCSCFAARLRTGGASSATGGVGDSSVTPR